LFDLLTQAGIIGIVNELIDRGGYVSAVETIDPVCEGLERRRRISGLAGGFQSCEVGRFARSTTVALHANACGKRTINALSQPGSDENDDHQATDPPPSPR
jgi:hypothetical protein